MRNLMGVGVSVALLAVGAILAFAVHATVAGLDVHVVGWILMGARLLDLIVSLVMFAPRRRRIVPEVRAGGPSLWLLEAGAEACVDVSALASPARIPCQPTVLGCAQRAPEVSG
jgi:Domain of unknown function (DUF6458)